MVLSGHSGCTQAGALTAGPCGSYAHGLSNGAKCPKAAYLNGAVKINLVGEWAGWRPVPYSRYSRVKTYSFRYPFPGFCEPM